MGEYGDEEVDRLIGEYSTPIAANVVSPKGSDEESNVSMSDRIPATEKGKAVVHWAPTPVSKSGDSEGASMDGTYHSIGWEEFERQQQERQLEEEIVREEKTYLELQRLREEIALQLALLESACEAAEARDHQEKLRESLGRIRRMSDSRTESMVPKQTLLLEMDKDIKDTPDVPPKAEQGKPKDPSTEVEEAMPRGDVPGEKGQKKPGRRKATARQTARDTQHDLWTR